jgi:xanthine dehydrogenase YagS FAD-binding subunit
VREFAYERAVDPASAVERVAGHSDAAFLGGGTNLVDHMRLGVARPDLLVDVTRLSLGGITEQPDGSVRIGAGVCNAEVASAPLIRERYPVLARALLAGASPQLRNLATTGGNLLQRTRCVYFQDITTPCNKREPGSGCSAREGYTRYHAILGASEDCVAVHPSDMSVALSALDAIVEVRGPDGVRDIPIGEFYRLPADAPDRDTVLNHGDLITAVTLPALPAARTSAYHKVRDRASYAFALVSVAAVLDIRDGAIHEVRVALGGVAHKPWRATVLEQALRGAVPSEEVYAAAADDELAQARPLSGNAFKIPMARRTIVSVLRDLSPVSG